MVAYFPDEPIPSPPPDRIIREFVFPVRGFLGLIALTLAALLIAGMSIRAESTFARASRSGDANAFAKASLICDAKCFAKAAHGCDCGQGCPCCKADKPCACKNGECALDARYNALREQAIKENRKLVVSVGCAERVLPGVLTCRIESLEGVKAPRVIVCKNHQGVFRRVAEHPPTVSDKLLLDNSVSYHEHQCDCGYAYWHGHKSVGNKQEHTCPECGKVNWEKAAVAFCPDGNCPIGR